MPPEDEWLIDNVVRMHAGAERGDNDISNFVDLFCILTIFYFSCSRKRGTNFYTHMATEL